MSLTRRGKQGIYWTRFTAPDGSRVCKSAKTTNRQQAQEFEDRLKAELWRVQQLGEKPRYLWEQAVLRWLSEQEGKASRDDSLGHLRWLDPHLRGVVLADIKRDHLDQLIQARQATGVTNATVNRTMEIVRAILRRAQADWEWIDRVPRFRFLPEPQRRIRWLTEAEAHRLLDELPPHLRAIAAFSLATGLRESNVTGLEWEQIDLERKVAWIHADQAKARKPINVPLNADAILLLRRQIGQHPVKVFTYRGRPISKAGGKAWRKALDRAGIRPFDDGLAVSSPKKRYPTRALHRYKYDDFRWHDLRHTWASWHVQRGTPLHVLQELGGWATPDMVQRYAHFSAGHLASYAENVGGTLRPTGTKVVSIR